MVRTKEVSVIAIPKDLAEQIKEVVSSRLGYITIAEYVRQAVREKIRKDKRELNRIREELENAEEL